MVKGLSRRVVIVRFPDTRVFEQAIFVVRDDIPNNKGISADEVLLEACNAAEGYVRRPQKKRALPSICYLAAGAFGTGVVWLLTALLHT